MKVVVLLSKTFFKPHPKAGQPTFFAQKLTGKWLFESLKLLHKEVKIHTCRNNYEYWKKKIDKLKAAGGVLSVRQWSAKPYRSPHETIVDIKAENVDVQKVELFLLNDRCMTATVSDDSELGFYIIPLKELAENDGLTVEDFIAWFLPIFKKEQKEVLDFAIIHFTKFRY